MARPRVFLSSTYYDLRHIRNDLERFVKELGYEPILSERGHIPYGKDEALEQYCYREISNCDILVNRWELWVFFPKKSLFSFSVGIEDCI